MKKIYVVIEEPEGKETVTTEHDTADTLAVVGSALLGKDGPTKFSLFNKMRNWGKSLLK